MSVSPTPCAAECVEGPVSTLRAPICVPVPTDGGHLEGEGRVKVSIQGCTKYMSCVKTFRVSVDAVKSTFKVTFLVLLV